MKLSVSNIGWNSQQDREMYVWLQEQGIQGLEAAPTRLFPEGPYDRLEQAAVMAKELKTQYGLQIPSMQSIWYGMPQRISGTQEEWDKLYLYTEKAIDFACACSCRNLVFGCPKNRTVLQSADAARNEQFLLEIAQAAHKKQAVIALEANPTIYHTNYINTTMEAIETVRRLDHPGLKLNLDFGTVLANEECLNILKGNIDIISHVHISEPGLKSLQRRQEHLVLKELLQQGGYEHFVSLEMAQPEDFCALTESILYLKEVFA